MKSTIELMREIDALGPGAAFDLSIGDVLESVITEFGGPHGFAKHLCLDYAALEPGSQARVRIMDTLLRLLDRFQGSGDGGSEASDEELEALERAIGGDAETAA